MNELHSVDLRYAKSAKDPIILTYRQVGLDSRQARLVGREALVPDISLHDFSCNAVIDWIRVDLQLRRATQHQWLADAFAGFGRRPYIEPVDPGAGQESSQFEITVQEPDLLELVRILAAIDRKHRLTSEPVVIGMEVSVDFTPKAPSDETRARLVGVLFRHLAPDDRVFSGKDSMPRYSWGVGHRWSRVQQAGPDPYTFAVNDTSSSPGVDTTVYFGAKDSDDMVRIMDKVVDRQNTFADTREVLAAEDKRCRVEVTLKRGRLAALGIQHVSDIPRFSFSKLQGMYFQFKLATVSPLRDRKGPVSVYREKQRVQKFLLTGISGLAKMDRTLLEHDTVTRPVARKDLAKRGKTLPGRPRRATGPYGTAVAYEELCTIVQTALSNLSRKVRAQAWDE